MGKVIIETKNLCKDFQIGEQVQHVLKDINIKIYKDDFTIVMGSSGSGKSTLLYSLSYMDKPTSGSVLLNNERCSYKDKELSKLHSKDISFVFQSSNLIPDLTGFENITYPAYQVLERKEADLKAINLLERFGIHDVKDKYPGEMSGGQQQRVAIARALVSNPKIIFADEPTGALDSTSGRQALDILTQINDEGNAIVMVTHDIKSCARGNRLLFLKDGIISAELDLGKYDPKDQEKREAQIFEFLKDNQW